MDHEMAERPLRVGQRWRRPDGDIETVEAIEGETVQTARSYSRSPGTVAAGALGRDEFNEFVLIEDPVDPIWRVTINIGNAPGLTAALARVGTVESVASRRPTEDGLGLGAAVVLVVASDVTGAQALVEASLPAPHEGISVEEL